MKWGGTRVVSPPASIEGVADSAAHAGGGQPRLYHRGDLMHLVFAREQGPLYWHWSITFSVQPKPLSLCSCTSSQVHPPRLRSDGAHVEADNELKFS